MEKLIAIILSTMLLDTIFCMDIPDAIHVENPAITKEDVIQARDDFTNRDDFWSVREECERAFSKVILEDISREESIELLKFAFCGPEELRIIAYINQEKQKFGNMFKLFYQRTGAADLRKKCIIQWNIDLKIIAYLGVFEDSAKSLGRLLSKSETIDDKIEGVFWYLIASVEDKNFLREANKILSSIS